MVQGLFQSLFQVITWLLYIACFASGSEIQTIGPETHAVARTSAFNLQAKCSHCGPERSATVRQEAIKIQAKRSIRGPESVRQDLQRSDKKQSEYQLNAAFAVRNRSGKICNGPTRSSQNTS